MITEDEFEERFIPKQNHLRGEDEASFSGWMYETYGEELDFVRSQSQGHVWTIVENDEVLTLLPGYHRVNRLGYILTENPWKTGDEEVVFDTVTDEDGRDST